MQEFRSTFQTRFLRSQYYTYHLAKGLCFLLATVFLLPASAMHYQKNIKLGQLFFLAGFFLCFKISLLEWKVTEYKAQDDSACLRIKKGIQKFNLGLAIAGSLVSLIASALMLILEDFTEITPISKIIFVIGLSITICSSSLKLLRITLMGIARKFQGENIFLSQSYTILSYLLGLSGAICLLVGFIDLESSLYMKKYPINFNICSSGFCFYLCQLFALAQCFFNKPSGTEMKSLKPTQIKQKASQILPKIETQMEKIN